MSILSQYFQDLQSKGGRISGISDMSCNQSHDHSQQDEPDITNDQLETTSGTNTLLPSTSMNRSLTIPRDETENESRPCDQSLDGQQSDSVHETGHDQQRSDITTTESDRDNRSTRTPYADRHKTLAQRTTTWWYR